MSNIIYFPPPKARPAAHKNDTNKGGPEGNFFTEHPNWVNDINHMNQLEIPVLEVFTPDGRTCLRILLSELLSLNFKNRTIDITLMPDVRISVYTGFVNMVVPLKIPLLWLRKLLHALPLPGTICWGQAHDEHDHEAGDMLPIIQKTSSGLLEQHLPKRAKLVTLFQWPVFTDGKTTAPLQLLNKVATISEISTFNVNLLNYNASQPPMLRIEKEQSYNEDAAWPAWTSLITASKHYLQEYIESNDLDNELIKGLLIVFAREMQLLQQWGKVFRNTIKGKNNINEVLTLITQPWQWAICIERFSLSAKQQKQLLQQKKIARNKADFFFLFGKITQGLPLYA